MANTSTIEDGISEAQRLVRREHGKAHELKREHQLAMSCMEFESVVATALFLVKKMFRYSSAYLLKPVTLPKPVLAEMVRSSFADWLKFGKDLEELCQQFETACYEVEGSQALRGFIQYVEQTLSPTNPGSPWGVFPEIDPAEIDRSDREFAENGGLSYESDDAFARAKQIAASKKRDLGAVP